MHALTMEFLIKWDLNKNKTKKKIRSGSTIIKKLPLNLQVELKKLRKKKKFE